MERWRFGTRLTEFSSWPEVLTYAKTGAPLYYQAPMDTRPTAVRYEARSRTIRIFPPGSTGRGRLRTSDPFTADAGHLDRFHKPAKAGDYRRGSKRRSRRSRRSSRRSRR